MRCRVVQGEPVKWVALFCHRTGHDPSTLARNTQLPGFASVRSCHQLLAASMPWFPPHGGIQKMRGRRAQWRGRRGLRQGEAQDDASSVLRTRKGILAAAIPCSASDHGPQRISVRCPAGMPDPDTACVQFSAQPAGVNALAAQQAFGRHAKSTRARPIRWQAGLSRPGLPRKGA